jgi:hypothetical protein
MLMSRRLMVETKEIALAVLGGSVGLASVLVVFIGFLVAHAEALPATIDDRIQERYKGAAKWGLVPTSAAILEALVCYGWFFCPHLVLFYLWSVGFVVLVLGFIAYAIIAIRMI